MVPSRRVSLHTPLSKGFSCAIISTSSGPDVCMFPSASQGCLVRLDSQPGKHPPFPLSALPLHPAPALRWESILPHKSDQLRHPEQGKGGTRLDLRINNPAKPGEVTQRLQQHLERIAGTAAGLGQLQRLESRHSTSPKISGGLVCRARIKVLKTWPSNVLTAGGKGRALNERKQALPPPEHVILRPFGQLASEGLVLGAESCRESQSQEKLALPPPSFVRRGRHVPAQLQRPGARGRGAPGWAWTASESRTVGLLGTARGAAGTRLLCWGVLLSRVTPMLLRNSPA